MVGNKHTCERRMSASVTLSEVVHMYNTIKLYLQ